MSTSAPKRGEVVLHEAPDGAIEPNIRLENRIPWLSLAQHAALPDRDKSVISRHLHNVSKQSELDPRNSRCKKSNNCQRRQDLPSRDFNLDAIITVGHRVNSRRGTQFRIWAIRILRKHLIQGHTDNQARLADLDQAIQLRDGSASGVTAG